MSTYYFYIVVYIYYISYSFTQTQVCFEEKNVAFKNNNSDTNVTCHGSIFEIFFLNGTTKFKHPH